MSNYARFQCQNAWREATSGRCLRRVAGSNLAAGALHVYRCLRASAPFQPWSIGAGGTARLPGSGPQTERVRRERQERQRRRLPNMVLRWMMPMRPASCSFSGTPVLGNGPSGPTCPIFSMGSWWKLAPQHPSPYAFQVGREVPDHDGNLGTRRLGPRGSSRDD